TTTQLLGAVYHPTLRWTFSGQIGVTDYQNRETGSIEEKDFGRYTLKALYQDRLNTAELRFQRGPFLGRSAGGEPDFSIFTRSQGRFRYQRPIQKGLLGVVRLSVSDYSDDHTTFDISGRLKFHRNDPKWGITISKTALQGRFLTSDLRLEFIDVYSIRLDYDQDLKTGWQIASYSQYFFFEDHNQEQQLVARAEYGFQAIPWLTAGLEEEIDHFNRDARQYSTLSTHSRTTGYVTVHRQIEPHWRIDLKASTSFISDEGDSFYHAHGVEGNFEYILPFSLKAGAKGCLDINSLTDLRRKVVGYLLVIF
ncbi:MAG: hypothetical protein ACE5J1_03300, partial [Nitrospiria bacterium]